MMLLHKHKRSIWQHLDSYLAQGTQISRKGLPVLEGATKLVSVDS